MNLNAVSTGDKLATVITVNFAAFKTCYRSAIILKFEYIQIDISTWILQSDKNLLDKIQKV